MVSVEVSNVTEKRKRGIRKEVWVCDKETNVNC